MLVSCNDWLDVKPQTEVPEKEMFRTEAGFQDALMACYVKLNSSNLFGRGLTMREIELMAQHWDYAGSTSADREEIEAYRTYNYQYATVESFFVSVYAELYNTIAQANLVLANIGTNGDAIETEQARSIIEAEALAIRAFCHMEILRLFGQMPKNPVRKVSLPYAEVISKDPKDIPSCDFATFTGNILRDFDRAEKLLEGNDPLLLISEETGERYLYAAAYENNTFLSYRRFRINYFAVQALKARLYLYIGDPGEANRYANLVIDNSGLDFSAYSDLRASYFALPNECIFALSNDRIIEYTVDAELFDKQWGLYLDDKKLDEELFSKETTASDYRYSYLWNQETTGQGRKNPIIKKYVQPTTISGISTSNKVIPIVRLPEMYMIAMETGTANMTKVNELYDKFMSSRNVAAGTLEAGQVADVVMSESRREFIGEGYMFYFYKRLGSATMLWRTGTAPLTEGEYIVPVPLTELSTSN